MEEYIVFKSLFNVVFNSIIEKFLESYSSMEINIKILIVKVNKLEMNGMVFFFYVIFFGDGIFKELKLVKLSF